MRLILEDVAEDGQAAQLHFDIGSLLGLNLDDVAGALEAMREAFRRDPKSWPIAMGYVKAAVRAESVPDCLAALEGAARVVPAAQRASLELERGRLIALHLHQPQAAQAAFVAALEASPGDPGALWELERLALSGRDLRQASATAKALAESNTDPKLAAEHLARAARHLERAGDHDAALSLAMQALVQSPMSPAVSFVAERLLDRVGRIQELIRLREQQIAQHSVVPAEAHLDIGLLARYRLGDRARAIAAFSALIADEDPTVDPHSRQLALRELSALHEREGAWEPLILVEEERARSDLEPADRATIWHRIGLVRLDKMADRDGALRAFEAALADDPCCAPALEGAGRLYLQNGDVDRLVAMHRKEAEHTASAADRALALLRAGVLMVEMPEREDEGIATLLEARSTRPGQLAAFVALERTLRRRGDVEGLAALYDDEIACVPDSRRRRRLLAELGSLASGPLADTDRAIAAFETAVAMAVPAVPEELVRLADLYEEKGDLDGVTRTLSALIEAETDPAEKAFHYERLAQAAERADDGEAALAAYRSAIEIAPASHPIHALAGRAFLRAGRHEALVTLFEAGGRDGTHGERATWLAKAAEVLARRLSRKDDAIALLSQALELDPSHRAARRLLASLYTEAERWADLKGILEGQSEDPPALLQLAALAEADGETARAMALYGVAYRGGARSARAAYLRLVARMSGWAELHAHYRNVSQDAVGAATAGYRAAEICAEELQQPGEASELLTRAMGDDQQQLWAWWSMNVPLVDGERVNETLEILERLEGLIADPAARYAMMARRASLLGRLGLGAHGQEEELALRRRQLAVQPRDPVALVHAELALERRRDRQGLVALWRGILEALDPSAAAAIRAALGLALRELGALREATDAVETALGHEHGHDRPLLRLVLVELWRMLGDDAEVIGALEGLAQTLPQGAARALCMRRIGERILASDVSDAGAANAFEAALRTDPTDYESLVKLDGMVTDETGDARIVDALMRGLSAEQEPGNVAILGTTLAARLIASGRLELAAETVERVLADEPTALGALMVLAELLFITKRYADADQVFEQIADHEGASPAISGRALARLAVLRSRELGDTERAAAALDRLGDLSDLDRRTQDLGIEARSAIGDHEGACASIVRLLDDDVLTEDERVEYLFRLAVLREERLNDVAGAIAALAEIRSERYRPEAASRLLLLGEKTGRWDLASAALETALEGELAGDREWEVTIRSRLASLLEGPLGRPAAAIRHYERMLQLSPARIDVLERLAELAAADDAERAIAYRQRLLEAAPEDVDSYRALRQLFLRAGDLDGAFCAEAVLEALGAASDEESYFYKQRRVFLPRGYESRLQGDQIDRMVPGINRPAVDLLRAMAEPLAAAFPIDRGGYGLGLAEGEPSAPLAAVVREVANVFGVDDYDVQMVAPSLGPAIELGGRPVFLLPRNLEQALVREQCFVAGALMFRSREAGAIADPRRLNPLGVRSLGFLLWAACELCLDDYHCPAGDNAMFVDIKRRLSQAWPVSRRAAMADAARCLVTGPGLDVAALIQQWHLGAARAAVLMAQDPAVALSCLQRYENMFREPEQVGSTSRLPAPLMGLLPFVVSAEHLAIRAQLVMGVSE